jgi:ribosomal protein S18 acetylase RimI-like enzyme
MSFRIRDATHADLPAVGQLAGQLVRMHHAYDPARWLLVDGVETGYARFFASQLGTRDTIILVAEDDQNGEQDSEQNGEIVGYAYAGLEDRNWAELRDACARLHDVFVVERVRRQGLARRMLRECIQRLTALGAPLAVTTTAFQNEGSQALLRSLGFRPAALEMAMDLE